MKWVVFKHTRDPEPLELQIAVLSAMVASGLGAKNVNAEDYLINKPKHRESKSKVMSADEVRGIFSAMV